MAMLAYRHIPLDVTSMNLTAFTDRFGIGREIMYNDVRLLMTLLLMALAMMVLRSIIRKFAKKYKLRKWHKLFCIAVFIIVILGFAIPINWPFANLFESSDPPEAAYLYRRDDSIMQVVDGKDTTLIAAQDGKIIRKACKTKDNVVRWKLPAPNTTDFQFKFVEHDILVALYHYKGTSEYSLRVQTMTTEPIQVSDSLASEFVFSEKTFPSTDQKSVECFAYISNPPKDYWVKVNDQTIDLSDWFS